MQMVVQKRARLFLMVDKSSPPAFLETLSARTTQSWVLCSTCARGVVRMGATDLVYGQKKDFFPFPFLRRDEESSLSSKEERREQEKIASPV